MKKSKLLDFALYLVFGVGICLPLAKSILSNTLIVMPDIRVIGIILGVLVVFYIITENWYTIIASFIFLAALGIVILTEHLFAEKTESLLYSLSEGIATAYRVIAGLAPYADSYGFVIACAMCVVLAFIFGFFYRVRSFISVFVTLGISVYTVNVVAGYFVLDIYFFVFLSAILSLFAKEMNLSVLSDEGKEKSNIYSLVVVPVCVICVAVSAVLPVPRQTDFTKIREFLQNPYDALSDAVYLAFNPKYFAFRSTGFGGGAQTALGGNVVRNNSFVMYVRSDVPVYLKGDVKSVYTGDGWEKTVVSGDDLPLVNKDEPSLETLAYFFALALKHDIFLNVSNVGGAGILYRIPGKASTAFESVNFLEPGDVSRVKYTVGGNGDLIGVIKFAKSTVTVDVADKLTYSVFVPQNIAQIQYDGDVFIKDDGAFVSDTLIRGGSNYTIDYYDFMSETGAFLSVHGFSNFEGYYEVAERSLERNAGYYSEGFWLDNKFYSYADLLAQLKEYSANVRETYLNVPDTVPERVHDLARELTAPYDTDFEKLIAIRDYLRSSRFTYTLTPGAIKDGSDFTDYFLFEGKQGYCTYFATAFAVLARCAGIPVRYAEGFTTSRGGIKDGVFAVTNNNAHSWPEAYLEGYGWVIMEPTPSYTVVNSGSARETAEVSDTESDTHEEIAENIPLPDDGENEEQVKTPSEFEEDGVAVSGNTVLSDETEENTFLSRPLRFYILTSSGLCAVAFITYVILLKTARHLRFKKAVKQGYESAVICYYESLYRYLVFFGFPRIRGETLLQYGKRLCGIKTHHMFVANYTFEFFNDRQFMSKVAEIMTRVSYGGGEMTKKDMETIVSAYKELKRKFVFEERRLKRMFYTYILRSVE